MRSRYLVAVMIILASFAANFCYGEGNSYVFYMSRFDEGILDICYMDIGETITISSIPYNWGNDFVPNGDIYNISISPKGTYMVFCDFNMVNGGIYRIDQNADLQFINCISGGFTVGGFSHDGEYYYTTQGIIGRFGTYKPYLTAIKVDNGAFDIVAKQDIPTTGSITFNAYSDSEENIIASSFNGLLDSPGSLIVYHFDREKPRFDLKQYLLCKEVVYSDMNIKNKFLAFANTPTIGTFIQNEAGKWQAKTTYWDPIHWNQSQSYGIRVLPDCSFAVVPIFNDARDWEFVRGGMALFSIAPTGELNYESIYPLSAAETIGMTPDGRYFLVTSMYGTKIGVFRINRETKQLEKLKTFAYPNGRPSCIRFLPQFVPKTSVKGRNWSLYSDSTKGSQKVVYKPKRKIDHRKAFADAAK